MPPRSRPRPSDSVSRSCTPRAPLERSTSRVSPHAGACMISAPIRWDERDVVPADVVVYALINAMGRAEMPTTTALRRWKDQGVSAELPQVHPLSSADEAEFFDLDQWAFGYDSADADLDAARELLEA